MRATFQLAEIRDGDYSLTVSGEVGTDNADELRSALRHAAAAARRQVRLDISAMPLTDSAGLAAIMAGHQAARDAGNTLVLVDPTPFFLGMLALTGLDSFLPVEVTERPDAGRRG
jgi:anti-anti-sigma factor